MSSQSIIFDFLKTDKYMALATSSKTGKPEVATVEYVIDGGELLINSNINYRKYQNIIKNPFVAGVVTCKHEKTLQFDGMIKQLDGDAAENAKQKMLEVEPDFMEFFNNPNTRFFRITPTWMRLRDFTQGKPLVTEFTPEG